MRREGNSLSCFFTEAHFHSKMGHNCFWANFSLLLRYYQCEKFALPYLDLGPLYAEPRLDYDFLRKLDKQKAVQAKCLEELFCWQWERLNPRELRAAICRSSVPLLLRLDLHVLHGPFPMFPAEHDEHYLVVCGCRGEDVYVLDQYFGFKGCMPYKLLEQAAFSQAIGVNGDVLTLKPREARIREHDNAWFHELFTQKLKTYLAGSLDIDGEQFLYGLHSLIRLDRESSTLYTAFLQRHENRGEAQALLSRRINIFMTSEREGMGYYLLHQADFLSPSLAHELSSLILRSARKMKQISFALMKAQLKDEPTEQILPRITQLFRHVLLLELDVHYAVEQSLARSLR